MTDETVDIFYSCTLCQSFAPNHVCIISPERLGLCGAYNWLDGKASLRDQPDRAATSRSRRARCLDPTLGMCEGINEFVYSTSNKTVEQVSLYSMMSRADDLVRLLRVHPRHRSRGQRRRWSSTASTPG